VILIFKHEKSGALGLQLNKPFTNGASLNSVMENLGMDSTFVEDPLYYGGENNGNRVYIVHTLDWYTSSTLKFNDTIGLSGDLSILTALSQGEGPSQYRAMAGYNLWSAGELESEINSSDNIALSWSQIPATNELVFEFDGQNQWKNVITEASKLQVSSWLA
jgi:putative transcriptional regulator